MTDEEIRQRREAMLDRLRGCATIEAVNDAVRAIAREVVVHEVYDPTGAIIIRNMAAYRRLCITRGWG